MAKPKIFDGDSLPKESLTVLDSAYDHACLAIPTLDRESFVNGFLYGMRFGGTTELLREFMGKTY